MPKRMWTALAVLVSGLATSSSSLAPDCRDRPLSAAAGSDAARLSAPSALTGWTMLRHGPGPPIWFARRRGARGLRRYSYASSPQPRLRGERARLSRQRAHLARGDPREPRVKAGPALRCGLGAQPQADPPTLAGCSTAAPAASSPAAAGRPRPAARGAISHGVALYALGLAQVRYALVEPTDNPLDEVPLHGFKRIASTDYYAAYTRCAR